MAEIKRRIDSQPVKVLWVLVAVTVALSLLYAVQYYLGGPIRLSVVSPFHDLSLSADGTRLAAGTEDGEVLVWQVPAELRTTVPAGFDVSAEAPWRSQTLSGHEAAVISVAFAPAGSELLTVSSDGQARRWQPAVDNNSTLVLAAGGERLVDAGFSADVGRLATLDEAGVVAVWDQTDGSQVQAFDPVEERSEAVALNADGSLVAAGNGANVLVWNVDTGEQVQAMEGRWDDPEEQTEWLGHDDVVTALAFSPDGELLVSGSADTTIVFWELGTGDPRWLSEGHWAPVTALTFDPSGDFLLTGGRDNKVRNIRVAGGKSTASYEGHLSAVSGTAYGPEDTTILSASGDGTVRLWETTNQKVLHIEWSRYGFEPAWGQTFAVWMLISGLLGLVCLWGLRKARLWSHLLTLAVFLLGPAIMLGVPLTQLYLFDLLQLLGAWAVRGLLLLAGLVNVVCWLVVVVRLFQNEGLLGGLLGLVFPPYAFVKGWMRTTEWGTDRVMMIWTVVEVVPVLLSILVGLNVVPLVPEVGGAVNILDIYPPGVRFQIGWPLIVLAVWYVGLLAALLREPVVNRYAAPTDATLSEQIMVGQRTARTRFGIYSLAVWIGLLVLVYAVLRRFNLDIAFMGHFFSFIMAGAGLTVVVSFFSIVLAVILALVGALGRLSDNPILDGISGFYISLIRGTPLLVQIFIWYLGLPQLGIILRPLAAGVLALGVNYGAYMTEIFRAGIQAISTGQQEAAQALGMSGGQTFRRVILPQAFRIVIPPIGNDFIAMMKDSSLVYLMGVWELTFRAQKIGRQNFRTMETFIIAAGFYWLLTVIFQFLQGKLEDYMARGERK